MLFGASWKRTIELDFWIILAFPLLFYYTFLQESLRQIKNELIEEPIHHYYRLSKKDKK
jgi:hypothetical protein